MRIPPSFKRYLQVLGIWVVCMSLFSAFYPAAFVSSTDNAIQPEAIGKFLNGTLPELGASGTIGVVPAWGGLSFDTPLALAIHPVQPIAFVAQRDGKIFQINTESFTRTMAIDLSGKVGLCVDGGFLGLVLHPDVAKQGAENKPFLYTYYSTRDSLGGHEPTELVQAPCWLSQFWYGGYLVLSRWELNPETLDILSDSEQVLIRRRQYNSLHRGGGLTFGKDGFLYLATGDQGIKRPAQELHHNLDGGVLRIDVDQNPERSHPATYRLPKRSFAPDEISGVGYYIPNSNPFVGDSAVMEEYYAMGFRSPHRMSTDPISGQIFVGDVGSWKAEEINLLSRGANYGWPVYEGSDTNNFCIDWLYQDSVQRLPLTAFPRNIANSIIGGYVYRGVSVPALYGKYICGDYGDGKEFFSIDPITGVYERLPVSSPRSPVAFGQDHAGEIYVLSKGSGPLYQFVVTEDMFSPPQHLSAAGVFTDLQELEPVPGLIPYSLNVPFWSDGAEKKRWMAIPNDGSFDSPEEYIQFSATEPWQFPTGTVFVKHFEWKERKVETRLFVHGEDQWYGLSYRWRADQQDAVLIASGFQDTLEIVNEVPKVWYFPGRNECLACHDPAAGSVLGPGTSQLNGDWQYPGDSVPCNQLSALNQIGIFDTLLDEGKLDQLLVSAPMEDLNYSLDLRARSYLDANCAYCHQPATGNRAAFDLRLGQMNDRDVVNAPVGDDLGVRGARAVFSGSPRLSVVLHRMISLESGRAMPPLAKNEADLAGIRLIEKWINRMDDQDNAPVQEAPYITVFPNPVPPERLLSVRFNNFLPGEVEIRLSDIAGRILWKSTADIPEAIRDHEIQIVSDLDLIRGTYLIQVITDQEVFSKRLVIQD